MDYTFIFVNLNFNKEKYLLKIAMSIKKIDKIRNDASKK